MRALGRYVVLDRIGEGGMGVVYAAYDPELDRKIALKLIRADQKFREGLRERLQREAQAMARLTHPNVLPVYDVGTGDDDVFIAMEWVSGGTLTTWLKAQPRSPRDVVTIFLAAGRGLAAAHDEGIVHCDFKADNVLVGADGRPRVTDFGIARRGAPSPESLRAMMDAPAIARSTTIDGGILGTPAYMAPEQLLRGESADVRTDVFSFSVALFEALTLEHPFKATTLAELCTAMKTDVSDATLARVPRRFRHALALGLATSREARAASMHVLLDELERGVRPRRWPWPVLAVALAAGVGGVSYRAHVDRAQLCTGGPARAGAVWSGERRGAAQRAFLATGAPYAERVWNAVDAALEDHTRAWGAMYTGACEATTRVRGTQSESLLDRRMQCLDDDLREVDAQAALFAAADAVIVSHAADAVTKLPSLARCADGKALTADVEPLPPAVPAERIATLEDRLARIKAEEASGRLKDALAAMPSLVEDVRASGYRTLEMSALAEWAVEEDRKGEHASASAHFHDAAALAARRNDQPAMTRAWIANAGALISLGKIDEALLWLRYAEALLERAPDPALRARLAVQRLEAWAREDPAKVTMPAIEEARGLLDRSGLAPLGLARQMGNLAIVAGRSGHADVAREMHERTRKIFLEAYGPDHPDSQDETQNLAADDILLGRHQEALEIATDLLASRTRTLRPGDGDFAFTLLAISEAEEGLGKYDDALARAEQAAAIVAKAWPDDVYTLFEAESDEGRDLLGLGRLPEARAAVERAIARGVAAEVGPIELSDPHFVLGKVLLAQGDVASALVEARTALEPLEKAAAAPGGDNYVKDRDEIRAWLGAHDGKRVVRQ